MTKEQARIGTKVKTNVEWAGVPQWTTGTIVEEYNLGDEGGVMVEWDIPNHWKPLRDGFSKKDELHFLEVI